MTNQPAAAVAAADGPPLTNKRQVGKYTQQLTLTLLISVFMPLWILWTSTMDYILQWLRRKLDPNDATTSDGSRLIGNFPAKTILENKYYHDVTLQGKDGMKVTSNKAVLAASCTVFQDMFDGQQAEEDAEAMVTEVVKLPLKGNTIKAILHYIHSGNLGLPKESSSSEDDEHDKGRDDALKQARDIAALLDLEHAAATFLNLPGFTKMVKVVIHEWLKENEWCPSLELCRRSPALQENEEPEDESSLGQYELYNFLLDGRSRLVKAATTDNNNNDLEGDDNSGSGDDDKNSFTSLPEGVLDQILQYVVTTTKDVCPLRVTCQKAKEVVDEHIYRRLIFIVEEEKFLVVLTDWTDDWSLTVYWDDETQQTFYMDQRMDKRWTESYQAYERKHLSRKSDRFNCYKLTPKEALQMVVPYLKRKETCCDTTTMIPLVWSLLMNAKETSMFCVEDLTREYLPDGEKNFDIYLETKQGHFYDMSHCP